MIYRYNILADKEDKLPEGYARMAGKVFGYVAEEVMQTVQSKAVRNVVMTGDTLVAASCDSLMSILRRGRVWGTISPLGCRLWR